MSWTPTYLNNVSVLPLQRTPNISKVFDENINVTISTITYCYKLCLRWEKSNSNILAEWSFLIYNKCFQRTTPWYISAMRGILERGTNWGQDKIAYHQFDIIKIHTKYIHTICTLLCFVVVWYRSVLYFLCSFCKTSPNNFPCVRIILKSTQLIQACVKSYDRGMNYSFLLWLCTGSWWRHNDHWWWIPHVTINC